MTDPSPDHGDTATIEVAPDETTTGEITPDDAPPDESAGGAPTESAPAGEGDRLIDVLVGLLALLSLITYLGIDIGDGNTTGRILAIWVASGAGVVVMARLVRRGDPAARWAVGFVAWGLVSVALSSRPRQSLMGPLGSDQGWLLTAAYFGCWAVGRNRAGRDRPIIVTLIGLGLFLNVVVALLQSIVQGDIGVLSWYFERPFGLLGNPVLFAGVMCGGTTFVAAHLGRAKERWWLLLIPVFGLAAMVNLSGSRIALLGGLVLGSLAAWRGGWRRSVAVAAVVLVAYAATWNVLAEGAGARLGGEQAGGGVRPRLEMWNAGRHAIAERPLVGYGPGRFLEATGPRVTKQFALKESPTTVFFDAHNVLVETATTTGIVGAVLLGGFAVSAARRARGPFAWLAAGIAVTWLLEPVSIFSAPLAMLALGLAGGAGPPGKAVAAAEVDDGADAPVAPPRGADPLGPVWVGLALVLALVGAYAGGRLLLADHANTVGLRDQTPEDFQRAVDLVPGDIKLERNRVDRLGYLAVTSRKPAEVRRVLGMARRLRDRDPARPESWTLIAQYEFIASPRPFPPATERRIRRLLHEALERDPWFVATIQSLERFEEAAGNDAAAARWKAKRCEVTVCKPGGRP